MARRQRHEVRPRTVWAGLAIGLAGAVVISIGIIVVSWSVSLIGVAVLAVGGVVALAGGIMLDVHAGTNPAGAELPHLLTGEPIEGTVPGEQIDDPAARADAAETARRTRQARGLSPADPSDADPSDAHPSEREPGGRDGHAAEDPEGHEWDRPPRVGQEGQTVSARTSHRGTVVVTGATGGIGRATALAFAERGHDVALLARGMRGLERTAEEVRSHGVQALVQQVDVANAQEVADAADRVETALGPIEIWVNNAFTSVFAPFEQITPEEFRRVTEVTYLGFVHGTQAALDHMRPRNRGAIVQVGSALAYRGIPLQSAYCGAKHAIRGFTSSLRTELLHNHSKVKVTVVEMPGVNTPQFSWVLSKLPNKARPVAPVYQPEVSARAVVHAAYHPSKREYWVGASTVGTILANRWVPRLLDIYLARTGYKGQQTDEPRPEDQPANLWEPADEDRDFGAHGVFDDEAVSHSPQWWLSTHRGAVAAVGTAAVAGTALAVRRATSSSGG